MKRSVELLGGGVLGLALGTVFLATPIASMMATYARATWSVSGCPPGIYTLAASAQLVSGGPVYNVTTPVQVPQADVVQQFSNVPAGQYAITAILRGSDGAVVGSGVQMAMTITEGVTTPPAPLAPPPVQGKGKDPTLPAKGTAGPRPVPQILFSSAPVVAPAVTPTAVTSLERTAAPRAVSGSAAPREWLLAELIRLSDPDGLESGWHQVLLLDVDGDGLADEIRIEPPNGTAVVWKLVPQGLSVR